MGLGFTVTLNLSLNLSLVFLSFHLYFQIFPHGLNLFKDVGGDAVEECPGWIGQNMGGGTRR